MFDSQQAKKTFLHSSHRQKLSKVKEVLSLLSKKSAFFADLYQHFQSKKDIQEHALDTVYAMVMNLVYNGQKQ